MKTRPKNSAKNSKFIPPPPGPEEGYDALIDYLHAYPPEELEKAGYLTEPSREEIEELESSAEYQTLCEKGLHLHLARKDYERLARLAAKEHCSSETLVKRWIRDQLRCGEKRSRSSRVLKHN